MKRRGFLQLGLWGGALLTASGAGLALWPSRRSYLPQRALQVLDAVEFAVLGAVAKRVVTTPDVDGTAIAHAIDDAMVRWPVENRADFKRLLRLLENGLTGLLLDRRLGNFTALSEPEQNAALFAFRDSRLVLRRAGYNSLRKLCAAAHYANPATWPGIGYPGPPTLSLPSAL